MIIDYVGVKEINGPLIVIDGVEGASYEEIVDIRLDDGTSRQGRIVQIAGQRVVVQVFEGTRGVSLKNTKTRLTGHPMELPLSPEMIGRIFDGVGRPIDGLGEIFPEKRLNVNGTPINPVSRVYPRNYINTGISTIDTLMTLIRGQKLPDFLRLRHEAQRACRSDCPSGKNCRCIRAGLLRCVCRHGRKKRRCRVFSSQL